MQNDERDDRARDWDPESQAADNQPSEPSDASAEDEFETAPWPQQDLSEAGPDEPEPDLTAPDAGRRELEPEPDLEPEPSPPPPEVEAYAAPTPEPAEAPLAAHSVPATEPGESTRCPRCGTENRPGISFCRNCGQRLVAAGAPVTVARPAAPEGTQACPRCGTHNRAGVAFCQNCGANLRAVAEGYVPPAMPAAAPAEAAASGGPALLGPAVLLIGAIGLVTGWLLPFAIGGGSLYDQAFGSGGFGLALWSGFDAASDVLSEQVYYGLAVASPVLVLLLIGLSVGGFLRPAPAVLQLIGLAVALLWSIGLAVLFLLVEVFGGPGGDLLDLLRDLSPAGIIFLLASLIVVIGALTRIGRS